MTGRTAETGNAVDDSERARASWTEFEALVAIAARCGETRSGSGPDGPGRTWGDAPGWTQGYGLLPALGGPVGALTGKAVPVEVREAA
jgi:hypothetical protein